MSGSKWIAVGAVVGALAVVSGAFGAHALEGRLEPQQLAWWQTAVQYQAYHSLALVLFGVFRERRSGSAVSGACFLAGVVIFNGTLYAMALGAPRWLGAVTPLGGLALIAGWLALARAALVDPAPRG